MSSFSGTPGNDIFTGGIGDDKVSYGFKGDDGWINLDFRENRLKSVHVSYTLC